MKETTSRRIKYSVVVPVFNEQENLEVLYSRLTKAMTGLRKSYELIFIDDGSKDNSFQILKNLHAKDPKVKVIRFTRNFGQHQAITAGFDIVRGETVITIDADLQNPPEDIHKLIEKLDEGYECVFGVLKHRKHDPFKQLGSAFSRKILASILSVDKTYLSAFRAMRYYVVEKLISLNEKTKFLDGLICWMGYKIGTVEIEHAKRLAGKTKYDLFKMINLWFDMVVSLTEIPLKISTYVGLVIGAISFVVAMVYLILYFITGYAVPGFATTVILISFFAGVQLFSLGILGEYIGRMSKDVKNRPEYIIREKLG
jgi:glycosyltransferase involved in cell wall biosynthesis